MNRRNFISALAGLPFIGRFISASPAASAIQPTCARDSYRYEVRFVTRDGFTTPATPVKEFRPQSRTIWLDGPVPGDIAVGQTVVVSPVRESLSDIPYYQVKESGAYLGIKRS